VKYVHITNTLECLQRRTINQVLFCQQSAFFENVICDFDLSTRNL